ncbi:uncharacterized protein I206_100544 [Kwoniella pini CBS 10737]|uniref:SET domain-containing protein n=1 Tax=Kwoniella pini CBS 10737 TaxID=1296096 RepID=A0AAJ8KZI1_9TREE
MPTTCSPPLTPEPTLRFQDVYRIVRETFDEVWGAYYEHKPPSTLAIINGELERGAKAVDAELVSRHQALGEELRRLVEEEAAAKDKRAGGTPIHSPSIDATVSDTVVQNIAMIKQKKVRFLGYQKSKLNETEMITSIIYTKPPGNKTAGSSKNQSKAKQFPSIATSKKLNLIQTHSPYTTRLQEGKYTLGPTQDVNTIPPYCFCLYGDSSIYKEDERFMPFIPIFENPDGFDLEEYSDSFDTVVTWYDPDIDIILVETLSRIRERYNNRITSEQIDRTRILPLVVARIENIDLSRDLPAFPPRPIDNNPNTDHLIRPGKRKWNQPIAISQDNVDEPLSIDDYGDLFCARQGCTMYGCPRHSGLEDNHVSLHSGSARQKPIHQSYIPRKRAKLPSAPIPCSNTCYSLTITSKLLTEASLCEIWPEEDNQFLIEIMGSEYTITSEDLCMLSLRTNGRTCRETVIQILALTLKDLTIPVPADDPKLLTTTLTNLKMKLNTSARIRTVTPTAAPIFTECNHTGSCIAANCWCFKNNWMCGRNCACTSDCLRRFKGCRCSKISLAMGTGSKTVKAICALDKCPCAKMFRECDPELCGSCGAEDELHLAREHKNGISINAPITSCGHVDLQKAIWPNVIVGISPVSGYGLFAQENIAKGRNIGEYVGEVISTAEGARRDQINTQIGRQYIFKLGVDSEIDAGNYGNLTRYFNSAKGNAINIEARTVVVNNELRIIFRATRSIKVGEELRFDYGQDFDENAVDKAYKAREKSTSSR